MSVNPTEFIPFYFDDASLWLAKEMEQELVNTTEAIEEGEADLANVILAEQVPAMDNMPANVTLIQALEKLDEVPVVNETAVVTVQEDIQVVQNEVVANPFAPNTDTPLIFSINIDFLEVSVKGTIGTTVFDWSLASSNLNPYNWFASNTPAEIQLAEVVKMEDNLNFDALAKGVETPVSTNTLVVQDDNTAVVVAMMPPQAVISVLEAHNETVVLS